MSGHAAIDPKEFKQGWHILLLALLGVTTSAGVLPVYGFGPLVLPLENAFGWSRGELQPAVTFFFVGMVIASLMAGWLLRRFGLRRTALLSLVALTLTFLALTQLRSVWMLYLGFLILPIAGVGTLQITWTQLTNLWFERNRGLALAIILCGTGICAVMLPTLLGAVTDAFGWRAGFLALALIPAVAALPLCYIWFPHNPERDALAALSDEPAASDAATVPPQLPGMHFSAAVRQYNFWALAIALTLVVTGILAMITNMVPLMRDNGLSATAANSIFGAVGISLICGRLAAGYLIDRIWAPAVAFVMLSLPAIGVLILGTVQTDVVWLVVAAALIGLGAGAEYDIAAFLVARYFGMADYSRIFSLQFGVTSAGICIGPLVFGAIYDSVGNYDLILWICGVSFLIGSALILTLGPYPRFRNEMPSKRATQPA